MARFNVGDKVVVVPSAFDYGILQKHGFKPNTVYTVSAFINSERDLLWFEELKRAAHQSHFDFYKEEKDMPQQTQQKTKRVPFTHELWERNQTAKVIWTPTETEILYFAKWGGCGYDFIGVYKAQGEEYAASAFVEGDFPNMAIEIPVTTKRIPFNPELKDAKVFTEGDMLCFNTEIKEWHLFSNDIVVLLDSEDNVRIKHRSKVQMEIEEDV